MAGKGGGAWKVAYADFVTAMMAFFMVMWLLSQSDKIKESVAKHFRNPSGRFAPGDALLPPRHEQYFKDRRPTAEKGESPPSIDPVPQTSRKPFVLAINNGHRTSIGTLVLFKAGSAELDDDNKRQLSGLVPEIIGKPQKIEIRGHAARKLPNSDTADADAWGTSFARCVSVLKFLEERGIPADRFRLSQAGSYEPFETNQKVDDRHSRVEVFLLSEVAEDAYGTRDELDQRFKTDVPSKAAGD